MTTCSQINNELGAISSSANSISAKLDNILTQNNDILNRIGGIESRLGAIESRLNGFDSKLDAINNLIDSLENIIVTAINNLGNTLRTLISELIDLIRSIFGRNNNDKIDEILSEIRRAGEFIIDAIRIVGREVVLGRDAILEAIKNCCNRIEGLMREFRIDGKIQEIIEEINRSEGSIKESIGGSEIRIIRQIDQNEGKLDIIISKIDGLNGTDDWVTRILSAIAGVAAILNLLKDNQCDNQKVIERIDGCCSHLSSLIVQINYTSQLTAISNKLDSNTTILNTINSTTFSITNAVNNVSNQISRNTTILNTINSTTFSITNAVNNVSNQISRNTTILNTINSTTFSITNAVNNVSNQISGNTTILNTINSTTFSTSNADINNTLSNIINRTLSIQNSIENIECNGSEPVEVELVQIKVPVFVECEGNEPKFDETDIYVQKGLEETELLKFTRIAEIEGKQCREAVAVIPEWWQVRLEGGVPQLVLAWGEVDASSGKCLHSKYAMTIPHFINIRPESCPFPRYRKGNYELIAYFKDNSKLIINAFTEHECERVYNSILPWIDQEYASSVRYKVGKRVSYQFKEVWVCPKFGKYFSQGNRDTNPDWTVYFN